MTQDAPEDRVTNKTAGASLRSAELPTPEDIHRLIIAIESAQFMAGEQGEPSPEVAERCYRARLQLRDATDALYTAAEQGRRDAARIEWLESCREEIEIDARYLGSPADRADRFVIISRKPYGFGNGWEGDTVRDAIDAAMQSRDAKGAL